MLDASPDTPPRSMLDPLDLLLFIARHKRAFLGIPLGAAVLAAVITVLMPNYFAGVTKILPPQQNQSSAAMALAQFGPAAGVAAGSLGLKNPNDLYVGMLKSRTVADRLIERFALR